MTRRRRCTLISQESVRSQSRVSSYYSQSVSESVKSQSVSQSAATPARAEVHKTHGHGESEANSEEKKVRNCPSFCWFISFSAHTCSHRTSRTLLSNPANLIFESSGSSESFFAQSRYIVIKSFFFLGSWFDSLCECSDNGTDHRQWDQSSE